MGNRGETASRGQRTRYKRGGAGAGTGTGRAVFFEGDDVLVARDPALFGPGRESFCRRLADALSRQRDVQRVEIHLGSGTCRVEFASGLVGQAEMARRFAESVHAALAPASEAAASRGAPVDGRDHGWTTLTVFPAVCADADPDANAASLWETTREGTGALRLWNQALHDDRTEARRVCRELAEAPGVNSCRAAFWSHELRIRFDPGATSAGAVISAARDALRQVHRPAPASSASGDDEPRGSLVVSGVRRVWYLTLAGGSFAMTVVGLIVPGIPTAPFLLATSYYLVRSSPALNRRLRRSRFFGPILEDLQVHGGLRPRNKFKLLGFTSAVAGGVLLIVGIPAGLLLVVVASLAISVYAVLRIPGISEESRPAARQAAAPALAGTAG